MPPTAFHVTTPHGQVGLWWLALPDRQPHTVLRQAVRQQTAHILDRQFPAASLAHLHWPPGAEHTPDLAYAIHSAPILACAPALWLSWSYLRPPSGTAPKQALLAIGPLPVGVDICASGLLPLHAWAEVLPLYCGPGPTPDTSDDCARAWTHLEASDKCLRTGLREWSPQVAEERRRCSLVDLPLPNPAIAATLAWAPPP